MDRYEVGDTVGVQGEYLPQDATTTSGIVLAPPGDVSTNGDQSRSGEYVIKLVSGPRIQVPEQGLEYPRPDSLSVGASTD